jgi:hypothetical protein
MAITIAKSLSGRYRIAVSFPKIATEKEALIASLRDHYSHIDERAIGRVWGKPDAKAEEAFEFLALLGERAITDGNDTLGVDAEATEVCIALRDYLVKAWSEIVARSSTETPPKNDRATQGRAFPSLRRLGSGRLSLPKPSGTVPDSAESRSGPRSAFWL